MASSTSSTLLKLGPLGAALTRRCNLAPLAFQARHIQGDSKKGIADTIKKGVNDTLKAGEKLKNKVFDNEKEKEKEEESSGVADRAKKAAENAWESAKSSAEKITKDSAMAVEIDGPRMHRKDDVEMAKRSMNTKKDDS